MPVLCLRTGKVKKRLLIVNTISHGRRIFAHTQVGKLGGGWGKATNWQKTEAVSKNRMAFWI
jgi:hypothetical protein